MRITLDIESRSRVELSRFGVYRYSECPDFQILMCAWSVDREPAWITVGQEETLEAFYDFRISADVLAAHNAGFERVCFSASAGLPKGTYLPPEEWHCSQAVAGEKGLPQKLELLAKALKTTPKDTAGTRLINLFCKPNRKGEFNRPEDFPEEWEAFIRYCIQDVDTMNECEDIIGREHVTETERQVWIEDQYINDRGMLIDTEMAAVAEQAALVNTAWQKARVTELSGIENPKSVKQVRKWLDAEKIPTKNLQAATVEHLLENHPLTPDQREVLELRQELALAAPAKFSSALGSVCHDDRLRGTLKFFGAHTGRWAGKGTQPHNLPRLAFKDDIGPDGKAIKGTGIVKQDVYIDLMMSGVELRTEDLKRLVRPMFLGPMTVVDYAAIEARVVAGLAGEEWALKAFRDGRDIYVETAERMGGLTRSEGKIAVLALGYNGGINSLKALGGGEIGDDNHLQKLVNQWRRANPNIVALWEKIQRAMKTQGKAGPVLRVTHTMGQKPRTRHAELHLPSGRSIVYRNLGWEKYVVVDPVTEKKVHKEGWRFDSSAGFRTGTYGGRLTENATQAVARDILAEALIRLRKRGYTVLAHVHDEILIEGEHDPEVIAKIMCELPDWAEGWLPIDAEGDVMQRYMKL